MTIKINNAESTACPKQGTEPVQPCPKRGRDPVQSCPKRDTVLLGRSPSPEIEMSDIQAAMAMQTEAAEQAENVKSQGRHRKRLERKASLERMKSFDFAPRIEEEPAPPIRLNPNLELRGIAICSGINRKPHHIMPDVRLPPEEDGKPRVNSIVQERMEKKRKEQEKKKELAKEKNRAGPFSRWKSMTALNNKSDDDSDATFTPYIARKAKGSGRSSEHILETENRQRKSTYGDYTPMTRSRKG